jgi:Ran GTPase-activating protein (RanGAP) involved in mRNA processing and transport
MMVGCDWRFLSELVLSNNKIGNKGAHWLAKGTWPNLKYLSLEDCNLSSSSMRYFVRGLLNTLKYLNLRENAIGL